MIYFEQLNTGQVKLHQGLGQYIKKYAQDERFTQYLEVGSWNGQGSTVCFAAGFMERISTMDTINQSKLHLLSLEQSYDYHFYAKNFWTNYDKFFKGIIEFKYGHILPEEPKLEEITRIFSNINIEWLEGDTKNFSKSPQIKLDTDPEVVLLDGGEYSTYHEYKYLLPNTKVFLLDDTCVEKCKKVFSELSVNPEWKLIAHSNCERNGWAVFERIE